MTTKDSRAAGLASFAALVADDTRAACLLALLDGRAWTAGELARHAGVAASTLSEHLSRLVAGGLLTEERQGRHRYVRLADARAAQLVEGLAAQLPPTALPHQPRTLRESSAGSAMVRGRTCYDHLAGRLGTAITDALTERGFLRQDTGFALTDSGLDWFGSAGIVLDRTGRRPLARACLDWTERRPHLAGAAGAALCRHALEAGWCVRIGTERAVRVTPAGELALSSMLGVPSGALH
ncbi:ArsR family transcriptional regulator [Streptomyces pluripotens]|uniref:ArsR family transcriptional regulator n=1 Tax=Streptomyces pluripotens TaxID=1355015 RepID=A0A221NW05_9ACTN|nr:MULTISPECIES: winged helix-turn-helix domain-containing protein [Streptomyces]ARP69464.1 transcriptional regulator [Streptomyces pluripotens]ASN23725.1 ArsR family transcriptional regulator [Streptomyces pluripotens]KIE27048.1 ArsR family transcriptional regulator [Streptomyces sp. MUSC 125]MCH0555427.1 winged helix-turn-helix transcriptional regulator [Streptomyces sp. MUM 16J]